MSDIDHYIASGILEAYCLGALSSLETSDVEDVARTSPAVRKAIEEIEQTLFALALKDSKAPAPQIKTRIFKDIYKKTFEADQQVPPLIGTGTTADDIQQWLVQHWRDQETNSDFVEVLPGNYSVTNLLVRTADGHPPEIHTEYLEYIVVLAGACVMTFDEQEFHYQSGDIITIPLHVTHHARITSPEPMLALVQRQQI